jgi:nucleotide-binding universal stress UspA family protein
VLVIPQGPLPDASTFPYGSIVVAWNGTRESARALHDALPLLKRATQVDVVSCIPPHARRKAELSPPAYAANWLARHGVHASMVEMVLERSADIGESLLAIAGQRRADLLVCGAYGRGLLREELLGGVTDTVLRHATIPTLFLLAAPTRPLGALSRALSRAPSRAYRYPGTRAS